MSTSCSGELKSILIIAYLDALFDAIFLNDVILAIGHTNVSDADTYVHNGNTNKTRCMILHNQETMQTVSDLFCSSSVVSMVVLVDCRHIIDTAL